MGCARVGMNWTKEFCKAKMGRTFEFFFSFLVVRFTRWGSAFWRRAFVCVHM